MNTLTKQLLIFFGAFILLAALLSGLFTPLGNPAPEKVPFNTLVTLIEEGAITQLSLLPDGKIEAQKNDGTKIYTRQITDESFIGTLTDLGVSKDILKKITIEAKPQSAWTSVLSFIIPILLPFLLLAVLLYFLYRQAQGINNKAMGFGSNVGKQANSGPGKTQDANMVKTTFRDVAGVKEAKEELFEVIEFLKNPKKFTDLGARIPRGVLLIGPPGCGKTLLAKAVAGEADVPFFHISGSEFMELFVGVGASRVRGLFQKAKRHAPCIVFIDELDSIGRKRGVGFSGAHDERDQTLNQILVEMDGFDTDTNVIIMAATNRPDVLDPALLRPGRFDRRVALELPDINEREEILSVHAKGKPLAENVALRRVAERTPGFSGADLANLMNESAILTARHNKKMITMDELLPSIEKVLLGPERKSHILADKEKEITAYHEAGHAIVAASLKNTDPVHKVSIIARGQAGGYTLKVPEKDKQLHSRAEFIDDLAVSLAGMASERLVFAEITTGAAGDLQHATALARRLITRYGMSEALGPVSFETDENGFLNPWEEMHNPMSDDTRKKIDEEIAQLLKTAYNTALEILKSGKAKLEHIAKKLLEQETIEKEEFEQLMK